MSLSVIPFPTQRSAASTLPSVAGPRREPAAGDGAALSVANEAAVGVICIYRDFRACPTRRLIASSAGRDPVSLLYRYFATVDDGLRRREVSTQPAIGLESCVIELLAAAQSRDQAALSARLCWLVRRDCEARVRIAALAAADALLACGAELGLTKEQARG